MTLEKVSSNRVSTGTLTKYTFPSTSLALKTTFNIFLPSSASSSAPVPVLFYLAGLTCTEDTGAQKGGFLNTAGEEGLAVVFPDTSPRGAGVEGEDEDWDFGTGEWVGVSALFDLEGEVPVLWRRIVSSSLGSRCGTACSIGPLDEGDGEVPSPATWPL